MFLDFLDENHILNLQKVLPKGKRSRANLQTELVLSVVLLVNLKAMDNRQGQLA
jgi:hypothetical protein